MRDKPLTCLLWLGAVLACTDYSSFRLSAWTLAEEFFFVWTHRLCIRPTWAGPRPDWKPCSRLGWSLEPLRGTASTSELRVDPDAEPDHLTLKVSSFSACFTGLDFLKRKKQPSPPLFLIDSATLSSLVALFIVNFHWLRLVRLL